MLGGFWGEAEKTLVESGETAAGVEETLIEPGQTHYAPLPLDWPAPPIVGFFALVFSSS